MKTFPAINCYVQNSATGKEQLLATIERRDNGKYQLARAKGGVERCLSLADGIAKAESLAAVCPSYLTLSRIETVRRIAL